MFGTLLIIIITYMKADILKPSRQTILREAKIYVMIAAGMILYGIGWTVFLLPNDITTGGVPGIASIVYWATGFPVQYTYFSINFFLLLLALKLLGLKFCIKTIFGVFTLTSANVKCCKSVYHLLPVLQNEITGGNDDHIADWSIHPDFLPVRYPATGIRRFPSSRPAFHGMRHRSIVLWRRDRGCGLGPRELCRPISSYLLDMIKNWTD